MFSGHRHYKQRTRLARAADGLESLVHANVIIAAAAGGVALTTFVILRQPIVPLLVIFACAAAFFVYTLNRIWDYPIDAVNLPARAALINQHRFGLIIFGLLGYAIGTIWLARTWPHFAPFAIGPPVMAWIYSHTAVRERLLVKNVFAGLCWAGIPVGIGAIVGALQAPVTWITALTILWVITVAAIIFDIKDMQGDRAAGVQTIPMVFGVSYTRKVAIAALLGLAPIITVSALQLEPRLMLLLVYIGYLTAAIPFASEARDTLYYGLMIDGEHIIVAIVAIGWMLLV